MIQTPPITIPHFVDEGGIPSSNLNIPPTQANKQKITNKHPMNKVNLRSVSNENKEEWPPLFCNGVESEDLFIFGKDLNIIWYKTKDADNTSIHESIPNANKEISLLP